MEVLQDKKTEIKMVGVKGLCNLIRESKIKKGDKFIVFDSLYPHSQTLEVVYEVLDGDSAETMIKSAETIQEMIYFATGGKVTLDSHMRGTKEYHKLLEE